MRLNQEVKGGRGQKPHQNGTELRACHVHGTKSETAQQPMQAYLGYTSYVRTYMYVYYVYVILCYVMLFMYACMHACMYVCMYVGRYVCM